MNHDGKSGGHGSDEREDTEGVKELKAIWQITKEEKPVLKPPQNVSSDIYQVKTGKIQIPPRTRSR